MGMGMDVFIVCCRGTSNMRKKGIKVHKGQKNLAGGMDVCVVCFTVKKQRDKP
jgi:hypothetical protein